MSASLIDLVRAAQRPGRRSALAVAQLHGLMPVLIHEQFNEANFINPTASMVNTRIVSATVPQGLLGILEGVAIAPSDLLDFDSLVFQVRVDGAPIVGYDDIRGPMGHIIVPHPMFIPLNTGSIVEITVRNTSILAFTLTTAAITGRFFPDTIPGELLDMAVTRGGG